MPLTKIQSLGITDGTIVNADINASAAIASTKLTGVGITLGTAVASTSGTSIDFTGLPSTAKRITVMFNAVSTNGTSNLLVQIGAGSVTTSGYVLSTGVITNGTPAVFYTQSTAGFIILNGDSLNVFNGTSNIFNVTSNTWTNTHVIGGRDASRCGGGSIDLGGVLDRVRITTVNGTDTFDAGSINIMYE
jgi:hypothetical protein